MKCKIPEGESGPWKVERFTIPQFDIESMRCAMHGRPVIPGEYTRLIRNRMDTIMSDTPAEIADLEPLFRRAKDPKVRTILINGLGLGIALAGVLQNSHIARVDVVEKDHHVVRLVKPFLQDSRIKIHLDDALRVKWGRRASWDLVWHDIWDNIPNEDDTPTITALRRKYSKRCLWQGVWADGEDDRVFKTVIKT